MKRVVAGCAAAVIAVALAVVAFTGSSGGASVGRNEFVNPAGLIDALSTPSVTINPRLPSQVVVVYRKDRPDLSASLSWSIDGGASFNPTALPLPADQNRPFFPDAAFGPDGTLYVTYANLVGAGNVPGFLWFTHSSDGGRTLARPVKIATGQAFQPRLTVGGAGTVDLTWLQSMRQIGTPINGTQVKVLTVHSGDGGATWSAPVAANQADGSLSSGATAVIVHGTLVVSYERFPASESSLITGGTATQSQSYDIVVTHALPGGTSFSPPVVVASGVKTTQRFSLFFPQFPSIGSAPDGTLYLSWSKNLAKGQDVLVSRSTNLGVDWTAPTRANTNPAGDGSARQLPTLSVAPNGRVDVVMIDQRNDHTNLFADVYLAYSTNRAKSFKDVRISSASFNTTIGPSFGGNLPPDLGAHLGVISTSGGVESAWADSRLGTETTGRQDIVSVRVKVSSGSSAKGFLLAGALVLLLVAAGLLFLPVPGRRSGSRSASSLASAAGGEGAGGGGGAAGGEHDRAKADVTD